jgi:hypothetical protein
MWLWLTATAKRHAVPATIQAKRQQWLAQGKERQLARRCRSAQRYVVQQAVPAQVFWVLDTDDRDAAKLITEHFGDLWDIQSHEVSPQPIADAASPRHSP